MKAVVSEKDVIAGVKESGFRNTASEIEMMLSRIREIENSLSGAVKSKYGIGNRIASTTNEMKKVRESVGENRRFVKRVVDAFEVLDKTLGDSAKQETVSGLARNLRFVTAFPDGDVTSNETELNNIVVEGPIMGMISAIIISTLPQFRDVALFAPKFYEALMVENKVVEQEGEMVGKEKPAENEVMPAEIPKEVIPERDITKNYYDKTISEYSVKENLLVKNGEPWNYRDRKKGSTIKGIVIHWTAAPNQKVENTRQHFINVKDASSHYIIGTKGEVLRIVPDDKAAFASGGSKEYYTELVKDKFTNKDGYRRIHDWTISIETEPTDADGNFSNETYTTLVRVVADKLVANELSVEEGLYRHHDFTTKDCPKIFTNVEESWEKYYNKELGKEMGRTPSENLMWEQFKEDVEKAMDR